VIFNAGRGGNLIEVESKEVYPSPAGLTQERGFQRQLAAKIRKKIDSKQYDEFACYNHGKGRYVGQSALR
jgi:hypothetical protein